MKTLVLIAIVTAAGLSTLIWNATAEGARPPQAPNPCTELRLEIENGTAGPISGWPEERILLGLFCAYKGDPGTLHPIPGVPVEVQQLALTEKGRTGDALE